MFISITAECNRVQAERKSNIPNSEPPSKSTNETQAGSKSHRLM
jgi:hypothetical protein